METQTFLPGMFVRHPDVKWNMTVVEIDGEFARCEWIERNKKETCFCEKRFPIRELRRIEDVPIVKRR